MRRVRTIFVLFLFVFLFFSSSLASERKSYFCIQVVSTKRLNKRLFLEYISLKSKYPYVRVEKINKFLTLRVGFWTEKQKAEHALSSIKRSYRNAFLRKCYFIPKRWIWPKGSRKLKSLNLNRKTTKFIKKKRYYTFRVKTYFKEFINLYNPTPLEFKKFKFPESRITKQKKWFISVGAFSLMGNYHFQKLKISYQNKFGGEFGLSFLDKPNSQEVLPYVRDLYYQKYTEFSNLKVGVVDKYSYLESLTSPGIDVSLNFFPLKLNSLVGFNFFRNGVNDVSLKNLGFLSLSLDYQVFPDLLIFSDSLIESRNVFKGYDLNRKFWQNFGLNFFDFYLDFTTSNRGGYLISLSARRRILRNTLTLSYSIDRSLPFPITSKGHLLTGDSSDYYFNLDPKNVGRLSLKYSIESGKITINAYRLGKSGYILIDDKLQKLEKGFLGVSLGAMYSLKIHKSLLLFGGGLFIPGNSFNDKSLKLRLKVNLERKW